MGQVEAFFVENISELAGPANKMQYCLRLSYLIHNFDKAKSTVEIDKLSNNFVVL